MLYPAAGTTPTCRRLSPVTRMSLTMLSTNCVHSEASAGSARPGMLLDAVSQPGDLRVDRPAFGHQGADFPVRIDDRDVVAAVIAAATASEVITTAQMRQNRNVRALLSSA